MAPPPDRWSPPTGGSGYTRRGMACPCRVPHKPALVDAANLARGGFHVYRRVFTVLKERLMKPLIAALLLALVATPALAGDVVDT
ncbi:MAG: hypothetical protein ACTS5I_09845, partial [Rhodanobacter sp.]